MTLSLFENEPEHTGDLFPQWWNLYPRKVAKKAAEKSFRRACKDAPPAVIVAALQTQLPYLTQQMAKGFCPHPTTWLNQGRWDDTPTHIAPPQAGANGFLAIAREAYGQRGISA